MYLRTPSPLRGRGWVPGTPYNTPSDTPVNTLRGVLWTTPQYTVDYTTIHYRVYRGVVHNTLPYYRTNSVWRSSWPLFRRPKPSRSTVSAHDGQKVIPSEGLSTKLSSRWISFRQMVSGPPRRWTMCSSATGPYWSFSRTHISHGTDAPLHRPFVPTILSMFSLSLDSKKVFYGVEGYPIKRVCICSNLKHHLPSHVL